MIRLRTLRRLWRILKRRPTIVVSEYGQATATNHKVTVSIHSATGIMGLGLVADGKTDAGHATVESYAMTLGNLTGFPLVDRRTLRDGVGRRLEQCDR